MNQTDTGLKNNLNKMAYFDILPLMKIFVLIFFFSLSVMAQQKKANTSSFSKETKSSKSFVSSGLFYGAYGLYALNGKMGNGAEIKDRAMDFITGGLFLGFYYDWFRIGGNFEYQQVVQKDSPSLYSNTNISGYSSNSGVRVDYYNPNTILSFIYKTSDSYKLSTKDSLGNEVTYKLKSGYSLQLIKKFSKNWGFIIDYSNQSFKNEIYSSEVKSDRTSLGLVFTNY